MTCVFAIFARGPVTDLLRYVFYYKEVCFEMTCVFAISARGHVTDLLRYVLSSSKSFLGLLGCFD